jgi:hypothetical protein
VVRLYERGEKTADGHQSIGNIIEFRYDTSDLRFIVKEWLPAEEVFACEHFRDNFSLDDVDLYLNDGQDCQRPVLSQPGSPAGLRPDEIIRNEDRIVLEVPEEALVVS